MKKSIIAVGCFFVIILLVFLYFFFTNKPMRQNDFEEVDVHNEVVLKLYEMANPTDDYSALNDVYKKGTFSNQFILGTSLVNYLRAHSMDIVVSEDDVNIMVKKIFGAVTYAHDSGYMINDYFCAFQYDKMNHVYTLIQGCDKTPTVILRKIIKARKNETEYVITEKMIVVEKNIDELGQSITKIYSDIERTDLIEISNYNNSDITIDNYLEKASSYDYYFEFDGESFVYKGLRK